MRIALLSDVYRPVVNGVVHHVASLKRHLEELGHSVWLFVPGDSVDFSNRSMDEQNVVRYPGLPLAGTGYHLSLPINRQVHRTLASMDVIHAHHPFVSGSLGLLAAGRHDIPLVFTNHTRYDLYVRQYVTAYLPFVSQSVIDSTLRSYFRRFSARCATQIAPSPDVVGSMRGWGVDCPIRVIPNGIDQERFSAPSGTVTRQEIGLPARAVVGVFVGRLSAEKRVKLLLEAFATLANDRADVPADVPVDAHLLIVGDGPQMAECRRLADQLAVSHRVTFVGAVGYDRIPDYLAMGNFFVSASVSEVHPLSFMEAAAAGLPMLGIRSPGICELICHGAGGLLAEDDAQFVDLLREMVSKTPQTLEAMGRSARQLSAQYSASTSAERVLSLYRELMAKKDVGSSGPLSNGGIWDSKK